MSVDRGYLGNNKFDFREKAGFHKSMDDLNSNVSTQKTSGVELVRLLRVMRIYLNNN